MADITWAQVVAFAPAVSTTSATAQTIILSYVNTTLNADVFGGTSSPIYDLARIYLAAHMGTMMVSGIGASAGPVISESAGGLSRTYANISSVTGDRQLEETSYGRQYLDLLRSRAKARGPVLA